MQFSGFIHSSAALVVQLQDARCLCSGGKFELAAVSLGRALSRPKIMAGCRLAVDNWDGCPAGE
jgi:hypothetical protein